MLLLEYMAGWAPADVADSGRAVIAMGYVDSEVRTAADTLYGMLVEAEPEFAEPLHDPEDAVRMALQRAITASRPVVLADTQDNPGGGGSGDTTGLLAAMLAAGAQNAALAILNDSNAVRRAHEAGVGSVLELALGGRSGPPGVQPIRGLFTVKMLSNGRFPAVGKVMGGRMIELGPTALLAIEGVDIVVAGRPMQPYEPAVFEHLGVDPRSYAILALKSSVHYRRISRRWRSA